MEFSPYTNQTSLVGKAVRIATAVRAENVADGKSVKLPQGLVGHCSIENPNFAKISFYPMKGNNTVHLWHAIEGLGEDNKKGGVLVVYLDHNRLNSLEVEDRELEKAFQRTRRLLQNDNKPDIHIRSRAAVWGVRG